MKLPIITNITEIRRSPRRLFDSIVRHKQPMVVVRKSKPLAVILDIASYNAFSAPPKTIQPQVFSQRSLADVQTELAAAHADNPQLVADVIAGLKRSSLYAKRPTVTP